MMPTHPIEVRLRATLQAAAPADTATDDGLADLRARLDRDVAPAPKATGPGRRRGVLAAAVVLVVLAVGAAVVATSGTGSDGTTIATDPPTTEPTPSAASPTTTTTALAIMDPVGADVSGWYIPVGLPEGWSLADAGLVLRQADGSLIDPDAPVTDDVSRIVTVVLRNPQGDLVSYSLAKPGLGRTFDDQARPREHRAEGQVAALSRFEIDGPDGQVLHRFTGSWPNADVVLGEDIDAGVAADPSEDDLVLLASRLRPVGTEAWRSFLDDLAEPSGLRGPAALAQVAG